MGAVGHRCGVPDKKYRSRTTGSSKVAASWPSNVGVVGYRADANLPYALLVYEAVERDE